MWAKRIIGFSFLILLSIVIAIISLLAVRSNNKVIHDEYLPSSLVKVDTFQYSIDPGQTKCNISCNCWPDATWCQLCPVVCYNTTITFSYNLASPLIREYGLTNQTIPAWSQPSFDLIIPLLADVDIWYNICAYTVTDPVTLTRCGQHGITTPIFINTLVPYDQRYLDTIVFSLVGILIAFLVLDIGLIYHVITLEVTKDTLPAYY